MRRAGRQAGCPSAAGCIECMRLPLSMQVHIRHAQAPTAASSHACFHPNALLLTLDKGRWQAKRQPHAHGSCCRRQLQRHARKACHRHAWEARHAAANCCWACWACHCACWGCRCCRAALAALCFHRWRWRTRRRRRLDTHGSRCHARLRNSSRRHRSMRLCRTGRRRPGRRRRLGSCCRPLVALGAACCAAATAASCCPAPLVIKNKLWVGQDNDMVPAVAVPRPLGALRRDTGGQRACGCIQPTAPPTGCAAAECATAGQLAGAGNSILPAAAGANHRPHGTGSRPHAGVACTTQAEHKLKWEMHRRHHHTAARTGARSLVTNAS